MQIRPIEQIIDDIASLEASIGQKLDCLPAEKAQEVIRDMILDLEIKQEILEEKE